MERRASACAPAPLLLPGILSLSLWETPTSDLCLETSGSGRWAFLLCSSDDAVLHGPCFCCSSPLCCCPQFQILRKLSQEPVATAMPSAVTPRQLTLLSWPERIPVVGKRRGQGVKEGVMGLALLRICMAGPVCSCTTSCSQHVEQKCRRTSVCGVPPPPTGLAKGFLGM